MSRALCVLVVLLGYAAAGSSGLQEANARLVFPQNRVDEVCLKEPDGQEKQSLPQGPQPISSFGVLETHYAATEVMRDARGRPEYEKMPTMADLFIGPGPDTFLIDTNYVQDGDIIISGLGVLIVDDAMLTLSGQLWAQDQGHAIFRNNARLHFDQSYVGQYSVWLLNSARFEATDATIDANGVMHFVELHDQCTYIARRSYFPDWTFRKVYQMSTLILEDVAHVGDLMIDDSCNVAFIRCDTLMPWFEMPNGSVVDIQFPSPDTVIHFELSDAVPGVDGIGYTVTIDTCREVWWSLETRPGCSVIVNNSEIRGSCLRIPGSDTFSIYGITNREMHSDLTVPMQDRHLEYVDTYVYWWNWYPLEQTVFYIDSCVFGEMIGKDGSAIYATRSIHDGATILLGAVDSAFVSFVDGVSLGFVCSWQKATLLLVNTSVIPMMPYQVTNLAHGSSYLLAANCYFEYEPEAMDTALVMFAAVDSPPWGMVDATVDIYGSAWIDAGPFNPATFDRYKLYWAYDGDSVWTLINDSTAEAHHGVIGTWNTSGMSEGDYDLRLTVWDDAGDSLTALGDITLLSTGIVEHTRAKIALSGAHLLQNQPNPFGTSTRIQYVLPIKGKVDLAIFNVLGEKVRVLVDCFQNAGYHAVEWDGKDTSGKRVSEGVYFYQLRSTKGRAAKKCTLVRSE